MTESNMDQREEIRAACRCGGWGVQDIQSHECFPCGPACINGDLARMLRTMYRDTTEEPNPDWAKELLAKLK